MIASGAAPRRIDAVDLARGVALVAMAVYHFTWDLEFFGYVEPGTTAQGAWKLFARGIASSFLFLAGVSLVLAHGRGVRWPGFGRRWAAVAGAALLISVATFLATPNGFIFFGILHQIALASVLGLLFLRLPAAVTAAAALAVIAAPLFLRSPWFDHPLLWWVGLSSANPRSNDYVPLFPWFGAVLFGIAAAKLATAGSVWERLAAWRSPRVLSALPLAGRHSLLVYLVHQPLLIGALWLFSLFAPAPVETVEVRFLRACEASCAESRDAEFCVRYCPCMLDQIEEQSMTDEVFAGDDDEATQARVNASAALCTLDIERQQADGP